MVVSVLKYVSSFSVMFTSNGAERGFSNQQINPFEESFCPCGDCLFLFEC